ncbi:UDP-N-acetylglucosamine pyrophosphorylase [Podila epigama]|nr:UDP-N-acetylglucosamine pyrophosphorylase [Podila epigama]
MQDLTARITAIRQKYKAAGQDHVLTFWDDLSSTHKEQFLHQLESIDPQALNATYTQAIAAAAEAAAATAASLSKSSSLSSSSSSSSSPSSSPSSYSNIDLTDLSPLDNKEVRSTLTASNTQKQTWHRLGLEAIANNKTAVVLLAGGQGTRLGSALPKGCYRDIGLPSHKTLFQLQAERIQRLQEMARTYKAQQQQTGGKPIDSVLPSVVVTWCIMTSGATRRQTEHFLQEHDYFGLDPINILIFEQGVIPCFDKEGKFLLQNKHSIATAPNGNGGLYWALYSEGVLDQLAKRGVEYVHTYSVDNILIRVGDPIGFGHAIAHNADVTAKVMPKSMATEPLGVICRSNGKIKVVEYSEMDPVLAARTDPKTGELLYRQGNICNQITSLPFLQRIPTILEDPKRRHVLAYHLASKKIPHIDLKTGHHVHPTEPNGVKLELFVFDVFTLAERFACLEVERASEFSPMKNAKGLDSPSTCCRDLEALHLRWFHEAGGQVIVPSAPISNDKATSSTPSSNGATTTAATTATTDTKTTTTTTTGALRTSLIGFEIGPRMSYAGEGLEWVKGKRIQARAIDSLEDVVFV